MRLITFQDILVYDRLVRRGDMIVSNRVPQDIIDDALIDKLYTITRPRCGSDGYWLDMNIDNNFIMVMNADVWNDILFNIYFNDAYDHMQDLEKLFIKQKGATLMAAIPFINKDFIMGSGPVSSEHICHNTDTASMEEAISNGKVIMTTTGEYAGIGVEEILP